MALILGVRWSKPARAATPEVVPLSWEAPPDCPTGEAVLARIDQALTQGGKPREPFVASARVSRGANGRWQAEFRVAAGNGRDEGRFEADSCQAVATAVAQVVALTVKPGAVLGATQENASSTRWQRAPLAATIGTIFDANTMPDPVAWGIEALAGPGWDSAAWHLRTLAGAAFFPPRSATGEGRSLDLWMLTVPVRACVAATPGRFALGLCAGGELAIMHASNANPSSTIQNPTQLWLSPMAAVVAAWNLRAGLAVLVRGDVVAPTTRRTFNLGETLLTEVYTVPAAAFRVVLGLEFVLNR